MNFRAINFRPFGILWGEYPMQRDIVIVAFCRWRQRRWWRRWWWWWRRQCAAPSLSPSPISSSCKRLFHFYLILLERLSFRSWYHPTTMMLNVLFGVFVQKIESSNKWCMCAWGRESVSASVCVFYFWMLFWFVLLFRINGCRHKNWLQNDVNSIAYAHKE